MNNQDQPALENKLTPEQIAEIEREAEKWVQSNPSGYEDFNMNDAMNMGKNKGYVAAAIKHIGNTGFLRNEISALVEQNNELGFKIQTLWLRIKDLEDGLRGMVEVFERDFPTVARHGQEKHHVKAKQLLNPK